MHTSILLLVCWHLTLYWESLPSGSYSNPSLTWLEAEDHESPRNENQAYYYYEYIEIFYSIIAIQQGFSLREISCIQTCN